MTDIPKDIIVQARSIMAGYWAEIGLTSDAEDILAGKYDDGTVIAIAVRAIMAERSRCAFIAQNGCLVPPDGGEPTDAEQEMCDGIAAAIRKGART